MYSIAYVIKPLCIICYMPGTVTGAKDIVFNESHIHIFMESYQKDWPMPVNLVSQQTGTPKSPRFSSSPCLKSAGRARKLKTQKKVNVLIPV